MYNDEFLKDKVTPGSWRTIINITNNDKSFYLFINSIVNNNNNNKNINNNTNKNNTNINNC